MHLTKVTLKNYGVYRDKVEFDFTTTYEKPVVLVGGTNGAGKTTLFESILVGFYGQSYFDKKTTKKDYEKFLSNKIHRYIGTHASADSTSIIIDFKFYHNGTVDDYSVDRTWRNEDGRIIEELKIKKNAMRLDAVEESQWQSFIEELIPKGIAKLFFFDGEKIVKMAEGDKEDIEIKSSFDSLLGLDIVEQLHTDLGVHIMRNMKGEDKSIQIQHDQYLKENQETLDEIERLESKLATKNTTNDGIQKEIDVFENKISKIGGGYASKKIELQIKREGFQNNLVQLENLMRNSLSGHIPFCLIPKQIEELKKQIEQDEQILKKKLGEEIINEKFVQIKKTFENNELWNKFSDSEIKETIFREISSILNKSKNETDEQILFNLSTLDASNILNLFSKLEESKNQIKELTIEYEQNNEELQNTDAALLKAPKDDEIGPLISKLNKLHKESGIYQTEIDYIEKQISSKRTYMNMVNLKIRNIIDERNKNNSTDNQMNLASKVQKVLDQYIEKLKEKKLQLLEAYLLEESQRLLHKENLITNVTVDRETFEINLYDKDNNLIIKDLLSKGEKQMFATAVLLALAKTSGKPLPFMIDTPLARLDMSHRDNMIYKFFPYASHQVVIFSTDSEIDEKYFEKLSPFLSRSYAMEYLPGEGKTKQNSGYFWNEKGEKVIAI